MTSNEKIEGYAIVMDELKASNERIRNEEKKTSKRRRMQEKQLQPYARDITRPNESNKS